MKIGAFDGPSAENIKVDKLGKYELLGELGRGAMGIVYRARDPIINRFVALKTITTGIADYPNLLQRFYREAQSAGGLQHPNIVTIYDMGDEGGTPYIAMELVDGENLEQTIAARTNLPLSLKLTYAIQACRAFDYAHKRGIVHRDVKPGNVMLSKEGTVKVVDFGIARVMESSKTQTGTLIGTFAYMSPEQYHGEHADERSDIWSFGILLYELLAYERPFAGEAPASLMRSICLQEPKPLKQALPNCPDDLELVLKKMLQKSPADRHQSMEEVLLDLEPICKGLQQSAVAQMVVEGQELLSKGDYTKARDVLRQALQVESTNTQARNLLEKVTTELRRFLIRPKAQQCVDQGNALLQEGKIQQAGVEAENALKLDATFEPAQQLKQRVQQEMDRFQRVADHLEAAKLRLAEGLPEAAGELLLKALELEPGNKLAKTLQQQVAKEKAERERRLHFLELMQRARSLWTVQDYEKSIQLLTRLQAEFPNEDEVVRLLETAREDLAEQRRRQTLEQARNLLSAGKHDQSRALLAGLQKQFPRDEEVARVLEDVREDEVKQQKLQALAHARRLLAARNYDKCIPLLDDLQRQFPTEPEFAKLLDTAREEKARQRKKQQIAKAKKLLAEHSYEESGNILRELDREFPEDEEVAELNKYLREEQAEQRKAQLMAEVRNLLDSRFHDQCLGLLRQLEQEYPEDPEIGKLAATVLADRAEQQKIEAISEARNLAGSGRYDDALTILLKLQTVSPEDLEISELIQKVQKDQAERQKQEKVGAARSHFAEGRFAEALAILEPLRASEPKDATVQKLWAMIRGEQQKKIKLESLQQEWGYLKSLMGDKKYGAVIERAEKLLMDFPGDADLARLVEFARNQQQQTEREAQLQSTFEAAKKLSDEGKFDEVIQALRTGLGLFPDNAELLKLKERAEVEQKRQQTRKAIEQRVRDIKIKINREKFSDAIELAKETLYTLGPSTAVTQLLGSAQVEFDTREEKRKQEREIGAIRDHLRDGNLDAASRALQEALTSRKLESFDPRVKRISDEIDWARSAAGGSQTSGSGPEPPPTPFSKEYVFSQGAPTEKIDLDETIAPAFEPARQTSPGIPLASSPVEVPPVPVEPPLIPTVEAMAPPSMPVELPPERTPSAPSPPPPRLITPPSSDWAVKEPKPNIGAQKIPKPVESGKRSGVIAVGVVGACILAALVWFGSHMLSPKKEQAVLQVAPSKTVPVNPVEIKQRQAIDSADKQVAAGNAKDALQRLEQAAALHGPLDAEIEKRQASIESGLKNESIRKLQQTEEALWQSAKADVDAARFRQARKSLNDILSLGEGGARREDAQNYLNQVIPRREREEILFAEAQRASRKTDSRSLTRASDLFGRVVGMEGPRKSEAERLKQAADEKVKNIETSQHDRALKDLQNAVARDIARGDTAAARIKADQIKQAGGDPAPFYSQIDQADVEKSKASQDESSYQQTVQKYRQAAAADDKNGLEAARNKLQVIAQGNGSHAADARKAVSEINNKLQALNQPPANIASASPPAVAPSVPATVKPPEKTIPAPVDETPDIRAVIAKYGKSFDDRNADELRQIWPGLGKRYGEYKASFAQASAMHVDISILKMEISKNGSASVSASLVTEYTPKRGKTISHSDTAVFNLEKQNGAWVIASVR